MVIYKEILSEFQKQKVKYVLVGGIALNLLGGYRNTLDEVAELAATEDMDPRKCRGQRASARQRFAKPH
jgi:hypothetical protein